MKKGFTLIELLIVITIIGILSVAFLPSMMGAPKAARDTQRVADVNKLATLASVYGIANTGCINNLVDAQTYISTSVTLADFGGKEPIDPKPQSITITSGTCDGYYIVKGAAGSAYTGMVVSKVEAPAKTGNAVCPLANLMPAAGGTVAIAAASVPILSAGATTTCFVSMIP